MTQTTEIDWRRELPNSVTVVVDGVFTNVDPDEPVPYERPVGRVVLTLPLPSHGLAPLSPGGSGQVGPAEQAVGQLQQRAGAMLTKGQRF